MRPRVVFGGIMLLLGLVALALGHVAAALLLAGLGGVVIATRAMSSAQADDDNDPYLPGTGSTRASSWNDCHDDDAADRCDDRDGDAADGDAGGDGGGSDDGDSDGGGGD